MHGAAPIRLDIGFDDHRARRRHCHVDSREIHVGKDAEGLFGQRFRLGVFPDMNFAGIDVAMTLALPVVIEANSRRNQSGAVHVGIPTSTSLD